MKVLIFSGGTGSIALQGGFFNTYPDLIDVKVLTNCYDNGKSTGAVRQVFNGKILGPSDLRKNQTTQYKLRNPGRAGSEMIKFLDIRFDLEASKTQDYCLSEIAKLEKPHNKSDIETMKNAVNHFFDQPKSRQIPYNDFSLSNIVYAGLAGLNNNSMITAGKIMAGILGLPTDSVILNDDKSLFLRAETESGKHILDEGDIVDWNNPSDPIKRVYFVDAHGHADSPTLSQQCIDAINEADIIVFSSGTQWSSLIPTYLSSGPKFRTIIENSKAKKFLVINNEPDKDMTGCDVVDMLDVIFDFLPLSKITKLFNTNAHPLMRIEQMPDKKDCYEYPLSAVGSRTHSHLVVDRIMELYYDRFIKNEKIVFDYDDTLVGRNHEFQRESDFNMGAINFIKCYDKQTFIFTGNYIKAITFDFVERVENNQLFAYHNYKLRTDFMSPTTYEAEKKFTDLPYVIYADGGVNLYHVVHELISEKYSAKLFPRVKFIECVDKAGLFANSEVNEIVDIIGKAGLNVSKVQNRNDATIAIKPVDDEYRVPICNLLMLLTSRKYNIRPTGRTTIDISQHINTKDLSFNHLKQTLKRGERITYVGDESHEGGNDNIMLKNDMVDYLHVNNPRDTAIFLITLLYTRTRGNDSPANI